MVDKITSTQQGRWCAVLVNLEVFFFFFSLFRQLMLTMRFRQAFSICFDLWPEPLLLLNLRYIGLHRPTLS